MTAWLRMKCFLYILIHFWYCWRGDNMRKILFTKYSNERDPRFAIRTDIWEESGKKGVSKKACYPQGKKHVESIFNIFQKLENTFQNTKIQINQCNLEEEQLILEYLSGNTLQEILDGLLKQRKIEEFKTILQEYISIIEKTAQTKFVITEEFQQVFEKSRSRKNFSPLKWQISIWF